MKTIAHEKSPLLAVRGNELRGYRFPLRPALIYRDDAVILRAGHIAQVFADRGMGKTWLLYTVALMLSAGKSAIGLRAAKAQRVLYIDGEMASHDIRDRLLLLSDRCSLPLTDRLVVIGADWQADPFPRLDTPEGQAAIKPYVDGADVVIVDNRSCLFDSEGEKDATAWQPANDWLLALRRQGKAVILAHHANRQGGARGHSKSEDAMDLILKLSRPDGIDATQGAHFRVEFEKKRGIYGAAADPFVAQLTPQGWVLGDDSGQSQYAIKTRIRAVLEQLALLGPSEQPRSMAAVLKNVQGKKAHKLTVFTDMCTAGQIVRVDGYYRLAVPVVPTGSPSSGNQGTHSGSPVPHPKGGTGTDSQLNTKQTFSVRQ